MPYEDLNLIKGPLELPLCPRRFRQRHSSRASQVIWLERRALSKAARWEHLAASRRGRRRLSAWHGPNVMCAPRTSVVIAHPRVSAPLAPVSTGVRRETAERRPRLAEAPGRDC